MVKKKKSKTFLIGRDARNGRFITVKKARQRKSTATVERMPKAGYGDSE